MDLSVKFEDFDSTERFVVLEMYRYDLILGMTWLEKNEPWIDWRGKAIGAGRPALSDRALVSHVPTSVKSKGVRQDRQGASASEEFMGVAEVLGVPQEVTVDSVKESAEVPPGVKPSEPREASRSDKVLQAAHQVGNLVPPEQGISRWEPSVGNVVPRGVRKALIAWEEGDSASNVGNLGTRQPVKAKQEGKVGEDASCAVAQGDSEPKTKAPQTRSSDGHYHVFDSETSLRVKADAVQLEALPEVAELLNLE
ncbi:unnamed protein product [Phytophthora fragariaefolia]|uniref:Unnamed protein product n=1 Tax=Phytophthora fragariaefolia TaxID=1490495 RepID=A0A9W6XEN0_9STRA|nr:unnamed protein product [Phytophthora fragariaefolia]